MSVHKILLWGLLLVLAVESVPVYSQAQNNSETPLTDREKMLLDRVEQLEQRLATLESKVTRDATSSVPVPAQATAQPTNLPNAPQSDPMPPSKPALAFADGTTLNFSVDGYYGYNFNHPVGRVNLLRANDVTANNFTLSQVGVIVERAPDFSLGRRFGYRLDLMFGQNTESMQGNAQDEPRPQAYRNIYQAYGSYLLPVGRGLQLDFGKFAGSLGYEANYTKDQWNYSRSYFFNYLPFYHSGLRATYNLSSKVTLQYWLVNGANQTEDFNGFKSQAAIVTFKPTKDISWSANYYEGQEQRDLLTSLNPGIPTLPTQPGLSTTPVTTPYDGRFHVIDSYVSFNLGPKWSTALEGDYIINRVAANAPPARIYGGAGYLHRQLTKSLALNGRFAYLKDKGGLFSSVAQDLKEATLTAVYEPVSGFQTRLEYRRDFTNQPFFLTNNPAVLTNVQGTATLGMTWWFGGKQGNW